MNVSLYQRALPLIVVQSILKALEMACVCELFVKNVYSSLAVNVCILMHTSVRSKGKHFDPSSDN